MFTYRKDSGKNSGTWKTSTAGYIIRYMDPPSITVETIRVFTNQGGFERGKQYYAEGRVQQLQQTGGWTQASVAGTRSYTVSLDLNDLSVDCECPAFDPDQWCKHVVALALTAAKGEAEVTHSSSMETPSGRSPSTPEAAPKPGLEQRLHNLDAGTLRNVISMIGERLPEAWDIVERVVDPPVIETRQDVLKAVKKALQRVKSTRSWDRFVDEQIAAAEEIEDIAQNVDVTPEVVSGLLDGAVHIYQKLAYIDDSNGTLQEAAASLCFRAIAIANSNSDHWQLLLEPFTHDTDLPVPMAGYILEEANPDIAETFLGMLEKHLYTRDSRLTNVPADHARRVISDYYAEHGDERLLDFLEEHEIPDHMRLRLLLRYHTVREEWRRVLELGWEEHDRPLHRNFVHEAVKQLGETDKLIDLEIEDASRGGNAVQNLRKLEHILRQHDRPDRLGEAQDALVRNERMPLGQRLELLHYLERLEEARDTALKALGEEKESPRYGSPNATSDTVADFARTLGVHKHTDYALPIWRGLFEAEMEKATTTSNYTRFEDFGRHLVYLNDKTWLKPKLEYLIENYSTRKKLVDICRFLLKM